MDKKKAALLDELVIPESFAAQLLEIIWDEILDGESKKKSDRNIEDGAA